MADLTSEGWQAPYSRRVTSLANYQHTYAIGDSLFVVNLVDENVDLDADALASIKTTARGEHSLLGSAVSADNRAAAIKIGLTLDEGQGAAEANDKVVEWANAIAETLRAQYPGFDIYVSGTTAIDVALGLAGQRDIQTQVGTSYLVIVIGLFVFFRHLAGTLATVGLITLSISVTMGVFGWFGATLEPTAGLAYGTWALVNGQIDLSASVVMCMSIGIVVDDTVHFLSK